MTSDFLFQHLCLLASGTIDSARWWNFSLDISNPRPGCFCDSQAFNPSASIEAKVTSRVRLFSSQAPHYISKWLHKAEQCEVVYALALLLLIQWFSLVVRGWHTPVLPPRKWKLKLHWESGFSQAKHLTMFQGSSTKPNNVSLYILQHYCR